MELFDIKRLLIGEGIPYTFLLEVVFRSFVMFALVLAVLRLSGKRGIKQLSIFELAIIISLGSAAGDPMFYEDVALLPALVVFLSVTGFYKLLTWITGKSEKVEAFVEGKPIKLIEDGKIIFHAFQKEALAYDEMFAQLRQRNVVHLGQVESVYLETSGDLSVFYCSDDQVKAGLPILPDLYCQSSETFAPHTDYACKFCGELKRTDNQSPCALCNKNAWIPALDSQRIC